MVADSTVDLLNRNDKALLSAVANSSKYLSDVSRVTGIEKTVLFNSARKLLGYGLVKITNEMKVEYKLSNLGQKYSKTGLPEFVLLDKIEKNKKISYGKLSEVQLGKDELGAAIGTLKKNGVIEINGDEITLNASKAKPIKEKNELLKSLDEKELNETDDLRELLKRKIIEKIENTNEIIEITLEGSKAIKSQNFAKNLVDRLTPEIIKNWKDSEFREYDLDAEPPIPLSGKRNVGKLLISHMKNVLVAMGFKEMQSNYAESSFWNFDVMMFKQDHPDRDIQDTVYINAGEPKIPVDLLNKVRKTYESGFDSAKNNRSVGYKREFSEKKSKVLILRGHTTATTFRYINDYISKNKDKPARYFSISKVFRNETMDQTHLPEFYQVEGIVYDDNLNVSHLIGYIKEFYKRIGIENIRVKPTYNPYTEPSLEIQAFSPKLNRWIEVGNSGVFRPETLEPFGIEKNIVAWGFGFDRMLLLRLGLGDMRSLYGAFADLDLLRNVETRKLFGKLD